MVEDLFRCGTATAIGSLPAQDPLGAAADSFAQFPDLPTAPTMPSLSPREGMIQQGLNGLDGVQFDNSGAITLDVARLHGSDLRHEVAFTETFSAFVAAASNTTGWIKLHLAGPATLAASLMSAGLAVEDAIRVGGSASLSVAEAQMSAIRGAAPNARILVALDEPSITSLGREVTSCQHMRALDEVSRVIATLKTSATTGLHCCAETDWKLLMDTGPTVLFAPLDAGILGAPGALAAHLDGGGWVCWGVVPTAQPVGSTGDHLWKRLASSWCELVRAGCDPVRLRTQALVSPECGLAGQGLSQAERIVALTHRVAERVHDQVVAVRFAMGA